MPRLPNDSKLTLADQKPPEFCIAVKADGTPCRAYPIRGAVLCFKHNGGYRPSRAMRNYKKNDLAYSNLVNHPKLYNPDAKPITDPVVTLQWLAGVQREAIEFIGQMVNEREKRLTYMSGEGVENLRADVAFYERMIAQFQRLLTDMTRLGIEAKKAAMIEEYSADVVAAFRAVLRGLNLTPEQSAVGAALVGKELQAIAERDEAKRLSAEIVTGELVS